MPIEAVGHDYITRWSECVVYGPSLGRRSMEPEAGLPPIPPMFVSPHSAQSADPLATEKSTPPAPPSQSDTDAAFEAQVEIFYDASDSIKV